MKKPRERGKDDGQIYEFAVEVLVSDSALCIKEAKDFFGFTHLDLSIEEAMRAFLINPVTAPVDSGYELLQGSELSITGDMATLKVKARVFDEQALYKEADEVYRSCWGGGIDDQDLAPATWLYEVLVASNASPSPCDVGYEIVRMVEPSAGKSFERTSDGRNVSTITEGTSQKAVLSIVEHASSNYSPRTYHNANSADLTVAIACDFSTAGEKLTHKAAGRNYLGIPIQYTPQDTAKMILFHLHERNLANPTINIAGNGIYTLAKKLGWNQNAVNLHVAHALALVNREIPIKQIISGGQTGVDIAGIVAAQLLQIDAQATLPKGFVQRFADGQDVTRNEGDIRREILDMAQAIRCDLEALLDAKHPAAPVPPTSEPARDEFDFGF